MPKNPIVQVVNKGGYWTYRYRDEAGGQHTLRFGNVSKVAKAQADGELQRHLASQQTSESNTAPAPNSGFLAVEEVCQLYIRDAEGIYVREDGSQTGEAGNLVHGLQPLIKLLGRLPAVHFRPRHIKEFCDSQAKAGLSRGVINKRIGYIKRMLAWAKNEELLHPVKAPGDQVATGAYDACRDFPLMRKGRPAWSGGAIPRESRPVECVSDETVKQTLKFLPPTVQRMIELQLASSMRPAEVCWLKLAEVETATEPWLYTPSRHKTKHRGKEKRIYFGPRAREILQPYRMRPAGNFVFRPDDAFAEAGELDVRCHGKSFTTRSYRDQIWKACDRAFPAPDDCKGACLDLVQVKRRIKKAIAKGNEPEGISKDLLERAKKEKRWIWAHRWSPNQLRHSGLTEIVEREMAAATERAKVVAGHSNRKTTRVYIDASDQLAAQVMEQAG